MPTGERASTITGLVQHESWQRRDLPPMETLGPDLWSLPLPLSNNSLRYITVYVLATGRDLTLIDTGWDSDQAWNSLCGGLERIGRSVDEVRGCLVTHQHTDHIGLAARIREASGAWIGLHPADVSEIADPVTRDPRLAEAADTAYLTWLGAPSDEAKRLSESKRGRDVRSRIAIPDRLIEDGEDLKLPGWSLRAVHTPGHTPGHLCFVDTKRDLLFGGDHMLPRITPHVSAYRDRSADALGDFLSSLDKVTEHEVAEVLPAHEWRFTGVTARARELAAHHELRLAELLDSVRRRPASVPWDLAAELTWSRPWSQYDGHFKISALTETVAHLVHLQRRGHVTVDGADVRRYTAAVNHSHA